MIQVAHQNVAFDVQTFDVITALRAKVDARLGELAPPAASEPSPLTNAMRDALLTPGKRSRSVMTLLCVRRFGGDVESALDVACAFEMVHAASLVLDDLPCMDDAAQRRGRPTVHRAHGEDAAVLAGVALLNEAFGVLARCEGVPADVARRLVALLSGAVGIKGLVAGQIRDLRDRRSATPETLERLNHEKTGVLFCAAAEAGAVVAGASDAEIAAVCAFARHVGAAFQIRDDLLDGGSAELAGKDVGKDAAKPTFVSLLGIEGARRRLEAHKAAAYAALAGIGGPGELGAFSDGMLTLPWLEQGRDRLITA